ncbi:MAG TPA: hypothetical protein VJT78_09220 [Candidatus Dormibacteraeota bacterium]|nr:hypothetical protein [Candidatus Dormibacteraeota bacterium]
MTLRGSDQIVIRDITNIAHPMTVGTVDHISASDGRLVRVDWNEEVWGPTFRDRSLVTFHDVQDMFGVPVGGSADRLPPPYPGIQEYAWSPDGKSLVFLHGESASTSPRDISLWTKGTTSLVVYTPLGTVPALGASGCESFSNCSIPNLLDSRLLYSPDGTRISLVINSFGGSVFRVWKADGSLLTMNDSKGITMSVWSGNGLYFRDAAGVRVMRDGSISTFLPGVAWIKPSASPGGGMIVYSARDAAGWAHTYVVDTVTGKVRELSKARTDAVFLTSRFIWYQGERACVSSEHCGSSPAIHPLSGKTYIYDLRDGTETESLITAVYDAWPHAA